MAKALDRIVAVGAAALVGAVVVTELRKPAAERTWHGTLGGVVPYDLRPPTVERILATVWDPGNPALLVPHAFGVGWTVNVGAVVTLVRKAGSGAGSG